MSKIIELIERADNFARRDNSCMLFDNWKKYYSEELVRLVLEECSDAILNHQWYSNTAKSEWYAALKFADGRIKERFQ